jgi:hypothetical protein
MIYIIAFVLLISIIAALRQDTESEKYRQQHQESVQQDVHYLGFDMRITTGTIRADVVSANRITADKIWSGGITSEKLRNK